VQSAGNALAGAPPVELVPPLATAPPAPPAPLSELAPPLASEPSTPLSEVVSPLASEPSTPLSELVPPALVPPPAAAPPVFLLPDAPPVAPVTLRPPDAVVPPSPLDEEPPAPASLSTTGRRRPSLAPQATRTYESVEAASQNAEDRQGMPWCERITHNVTPRRDARATARSAAIASFSSSGGANDGSMPPTAPSSSR
jgi:hypothetical protein